MTTLIINNTINTAVMNPGAAVASSILVSKSEKPVVLNSTPAELTSAQADSLYAPQTEAARPAFSSGGTGIRTCGPG